MGPLQRDFDTRFSVLSHKANPRTELERIWAYLDTLAKPETDNRDEAIKICVSHINYVRLMCEPADEPFKIDASWVYERLGDALAKLKSMGVEV